MDLIYRTILKGLISNFQMFVSLLQLTKKHSKNSKSIIRKLDLVPGTILKGYEGRILIHMAHSTL